jgi:hypothetical protein
MLVVQEVFRWLVQRYERAICLLAEARPFLLPPSTTHVVTSPPLKSKMAAKQHVMFFLATIRQADKTLLLPSGIAIDRKNMAQLSKMNTTQKKHWTV